MDDEISNTELHLAEWLTESKKLILAIAKRSRLQQELCPFSDFGATSRTESLKGLAEVNAEIDEHCTHLGQIEDEASNKIGCGILMGTAVEHSRPLHIATVLLIAARLSKGLRSECRSIADLIELSAGGCPVSALIVRDAFRQPDGVLLRWVHLSRDHNLDLCCVDLSDMAFSAAFNRDVSLVESAYSVLETAEGSPFRMRR